MDVVFKTEQAVFNYRVVGVLIQNGHVLIHRAANDSTWSLPGGRVAIAEDSKASLKREFREELDINIKIDRLLWVVENFFTYEDRQFHEIGFYYSIELDGNTMGLGQQPFHGVEGERLIYQWMPIELLENVPLYPEFLRTALKNVPKQTGHLVVKQ